MTSALSFLGGAKNRLLPADVPFSYFTAAAGFHVLAWMILLLGADDLPGFVGGPGLILAALHLLTLGVLVMTAMGAAFQLLPVATRQPLVRTWPARLSFWLFAPGSLILAYGMVDGTLAMLNVGAIGVGTGLAIFVILTADNLRRAGSMPLVAAHGWFALAALIGFAGLGFALIVDFDTGFLQHRQPIVLTHMLLAAFGFMGLLAFGFSHVLIPMFVLSRALPEKLGWLELALAVSAIVMSVVGMLLENVYAVASAAIIGLAASAVYILLMRTALRTSMRKRHGLSFVLIRFSWAMLMLSLFTALALSLEVPVPNGLTLFGFFLLAGWLLTFLTGVLQRIMPFLASLHAVNKSGAPPLLSELTAEGPLKLHAICHAAALVLCSIGIIVEAVALIRLGALSGLVGAIAFAAFTANVVLQLKRPKAS